MRLVAHSRFWRCAAIALVTFTSACADSGPTSSSSPLAGLTRGATGDSSSTPPDTAASSPGYFHGTVLGHEQFTSGTDTLNALPRVANARVTAYSHASPTSGDTLGVGPEVASVLTGANGQFQLPTLPGGLYIVTINPPSGSKYQGVWVTAIAHSHSGDYSWWVVLPIK
jgi:hypothetical protein